MDGSVHGSLLETVKTLSELLDLACPPEQAAVVRTLGYVLSRQDAPGHFGEGCEPERHAAGECRHALGGFFSPATRDDEFSPQRFPSGTVIEIEEDARFAASCLALRTVLRAREDRRTPVRRHIESLLELGSLWDGQSDRWSLDLRGFALAALGGAPYEYRSATARCADAVIAMQSADGTWTGGNQIHLLDALLGFPSTEVSQAIQRAVPGLLALQQQDGSFSPDGDEEVTLIAMRVLARVAGQG
jgi:hypothetical protein